MPSRSIIRTGVGPHREPGNRFPAMAAINLLAARAARVQSRRNLGRSLSPKLDHSHSITRFDRSRTGPTSVRRSSGPRGARPLSTRVGGLCGFGAGAAPIDQREAQAGPGGFSIDQQRQCRGQLCRRDRRPRRLPLGERHRAGTLESFAVGNSGASCPARRSRRRLQ